MTTTHQTIILDIYIYEFPPFAIEQKAGGCSLNLAS